MAPGMNGTARRRRHVRFLAVALALGLSSLSCSHPFDVGGYFDGGDVEIRIANESGFVFDRVEVGFPEQRVDYGGIPAGGESDYRGVSKAYRYAYIEVEVNGTEYRLQPIDYVGESLLRSGRYTYALNLSGAPPNLGLEFRRDE